MVSETVSEELLSESIGDPLPDDIPNVVDWFEQATKNSPDKLAIVSRHQPSDLYSFVHGDEKLKNGPHLRWTYRALRQGAYALARSLQYHGICKGMTISTVVQNSIEWVVIVYAASLLGVPVMPIGAHTLINHDEAVHKFKTGDAKVLIAGDPQVASSIDKLDLSGLQIKLKIVIDLTKNMQGWIDFGSLLDQTLLDKENFSFARPTHEDKDLCMIAFTSGSTSSPKGCPLTQGNLKCTLYGVSQRKSVDGNSCGAHYMPNSHVMGFYYMLLFLVRGATVVITAAAFEVNSVLESFKEYGCTNMICVPTMLYALLEQASNGKDEFKTLDQIDIAGAAVTPKNVRDSIYLLGSKHVGSSFGMTETTACRSNGVSNPEDLINGEWVLCGTALAGSRLRVCEYGTERIVKRGEFGEIHEAGFQLIDQYIGNRNPEDFYIDEKGIKWFRTGDQAVMWEDGNISIVGRYKDMIIRGGENISPAVIEKVLNQLDGVESQVVGCKDEIAGELPVAVYHAHKPVSVESMKDIILEKLGPIFLPAYFLTLQDLGVDDFPKTASGKVQKPELRTLVLKYIEAREGKDVNGVNGFHDSLRDQILAIWSNLLGIAEGKLDLQSSVDEFADSITIMRFRNKLMKETGKTISLDEMAANETIASQISLLQNRSNESTGPPMPYAVERSGPPTADDMVHAQGDEELAEKMRDLVSDVIEPLGFTWEDDVEDVMPVYDYVDTIFVRQRFISHNRRHAHVTSSHDEQTLRSALQAALSKHSNLRSFMVRQDIGNGHDQAFFVTMRPNKRWFDRAIIQRGTLKHVSNLKHFGSTNTCIDHTFPGPLYQAYIFHIDETGTAGYCDNISHATFDATSARLFGDDLQRILSDPTHTLQPHIPYKFWADTFFSFRDSAIAQRQVKWHVKRLKNICNHEKALFPPQRAPRWFLGPTRGWEPAFVDKIADYSNLYREDLSEPTSYETDGTSWRGEIPSLKKLRSAIPQLTSPVVAKAAFAMLNVHYTGHTHALFSVVESGRDGLPFLPAHLAPQLEHINPTDIAGPTFTYVVDLIEVRASEPLSAFLARLQAEQTQLTRYAHAPVRAIRAALGTNEQRSAAGDVYADVLRRLVFNWVPGGGSTAGDGHRALRGVLSSSQSDIGLVLVAGVGGDNGLTLTLNARWDDANTTRDEATGLVEALANIVTWITEGGDWDRPVGGFAECLGATNGW